MSSFISTVVVSRSGHGGCGVGVRVRQGTTGKESLPLILPSTSPVPPEGEGEGPGPRETWRNESGLLLESQEPSNSSFYDPKSNTPKGTSSVGRPATRWVGEFRSTTPGPDPVGPDVRVAPEHSGRTAGHSGDVGRGVDRYLQSLWVILPATRPVFCAGRLGGRQYLM